MRRHLGLLAGSRVHFVLTDSNSYEIIPVTQSVKALKGLVAAPVRPVSLAEMDRAIAAAAAGVGTA